MGISVAVGLICILSLPGIALAIPPNVQDGNFTSSWAFDVLKEDPAQCTARFTHHSTGGNPDSCMEIATVTGSSTRVWALMWKTDYSWDPATDGSICYLRMEIDEKAIWSFGNGQNIKILVVQDGNYYGATFDPWPTNGGTGTTWETVSIGPAYVDNFFKVPPWPYDLDSKPDFSPSGGPMHFGFMVGNTSTQDTVFHCYDNWKIWIHLPPSAVEPATWGGIKALYR
jgi:hypothetical protein